MTPTSFCVNDKNLKHIGKTLGKTSEKGFYQSRKNLYKTSLELCIIANKDISFCRRRYYVSICLIFQMLMNTVTCILGILCFGLLRILFVNLNYLVYIRCPKSSIKPLYPRKCRGTYWLFLCWKMYIVWYQREYTAWANFTKVELTSFTASCNAILLI